MAETDIIDGTNRLALRMATLFEERQENNYVFSSLGLHEFLSLIFQDPGYPNKEQLASLLSIPEIELTPKFYRDILMYISSLRSIQVSNKAFLKGTYELREQFKAHLVGDFLCGVEASDFNIRKDTANSFNLWMENNSNKVIKNWITEDTLEESIRFALLNVTNQEGQWTHQFNSENTIPEIFHLNNDDTVEVPMMKMRAEVPYAYIADVKCHILQLPFSNNDDLSMLIVLPDEYGNLTDICYDAWDILAAGFDRMEKQEVDISLPKFKIETNLDLKDMLNNENDFKRALGDANLFGVINSEEWLNISKIQQTGIINVHEKGSEIANGTIFTFVPSEQYDKEYPSKDGLVIYEMSIKSNVSNRFAENLVVSKVKNTNKSAKEATFTVVLPDTAFITGFVMEIDGKVYKSYIKKKEEAKAIYTEAVARGRSAGIVAASARDSNEFDVSVNLEPESTAVFSLTYEEMLQRVHDQYELVLNIRPAQVVENLNIEVIINESRPLKFVKTPALRSGTEMSKNEEYLMPSADIKINSESAVVKFNPTTKQQKRIAGYLGTEMAQGFSGQFVVQYDVEREPYGGEILLQDGYFVHFFAPNDLDPLPKHVIFILDTSTSMCGRKISQLKDAMLSILNEIRPNDLINIIEFNSEVIVWDINSQQSKILNYFDNYEEPFCELKTFALPPPVRATNEILIKAKKVVQEIEATGSTYMIGGLEAGLFLVQLGQELGDENGRKHQPIIVFLTDGAPNIGISSTDEIVKKVTTLNFRNSKVPIFSLSFGCGADKDFLRQLSSKNLGFSRHIYEASDASLQLQAFYKQISSPLLTDVKFSYDSEVKDLTRSSFPIYFRGSEIVVSGRYADDRLPATINCRGSNGSVTLSSTIAHPVSSLERLWAYLTVKQLLEDKAVKATNPDLVSKATEIALKYSFVTELTSLVVVKPDRNDSIGDEAPEELDLKEQRDGLPKKKVIRKRIIRKCKDNSSDISEDVMITEELQDAMFVEELPEELTLTEAVILRKVPKKKIPQFKADHPFFVILRLKRGDNNMILLVTRINQPR